MAEISQALDFNTFNTQGDTNGSGVELSDSFDTFRKKTNGVINKMSEITPFAYGTITWELDALGNPTLSLSNSLNVNSISFGNTSYSSISNYIDVEFSDAADNENYSIASSIGVTGSTAPAEGFTNGGQIKTYNQTTAGFYIYSSITFRTGTAGDGDDYWHYFSLFNRPTYVNRISFIIF